MEAKMICVMDVKVAIVPNRIWEIVRMENCDYMIRVANGDGEPKGISVGLIRETIRGESFSNCRGEKVYIGMSEKVQKAIGLPFEAFENMQREIDGYNLTLCQCRSRSAMYQKRIEVYNNASFFRKLLFLLKGRDV